MVNDTVREKDILSTGFSILFPVYNEGKIIESNTKKICKFLKSSGFTKFEILLCDNASKDNTKKVSQKLVKKYNEIKYVYTEIKGIGSGIKSSINASRFDTQIMISIDLAFDSRFVYNSILTMLKDDADVVIGSKRHDGSIVKRPFIRKVASLVYNAMINLLFNLNIVDTQGAVTFSKKSVSKFLKKLTSDDAFFQTQFMIYGKLNHLKIVEIPINATDTRKSSFSIRKEAFNMSAKLIKEFFKVNFKK